MTPHIYAPPRAAVGELPMVHGGLSADVVAIMMNSYLHPVLNLDGEERRSGDDRRSGTNRRGGKKRRGDDRAHIVPRRIRGDRRERSWMLLSRIASSVIMVIV